MSARLSARGRGGEAPKLISRHSAIMKLYAVCTLHKTGWGTRSGIADRGSPGREVPPHGRLPFTLAAAMATAAQEKADFDAAKEQRVPPRVTDFNDAMRYDPPDRNDDPDTMRGGYRDRYD